MMENMDNLDRVFYSYIKEIQKTYVSLSKTQRIRVEKWIEKLTSTGRNPTWRKHRNMYTKLLLNMIITQNLEDPFNVPPEDGPLPQFPSHLIAKTKRDMIGPHESSFWRELYKKLDDSHDNSSNESNIDSTIQSISQPGLSREIHNLNLLIKEQQQRIELLEQQLRDERIKYELENQRLRYAHKMEIENLKKGASSRPDVMPPAKSVSLTSLLNTANCRSNEDSFTRSSVSLPNSVPISSHGFALNDNFSTLSTSSIDIVPNATTARSSPPLSSASSIPNINHQVSTMRSSYSEPSSSATPAPTSTEDFMAYIEKFQSDLKNLQNLTSPMR